MARTITTLWSAVSRKRRRSTVAAVVATLVALLLAGPLGVLDAAVDRGPNLLTAEQQNFETGTRGWIAGEVSSIRSSGGIYYNGGRSMRVQAKPRAAALGPSLASTIPGSKGVRVSAGTTYDGSIRIKAGYYTREARCELRWFRSDGVSLGTSVGASVTATPTRWTQASCSARAPSGAVTAALRVVFPSVRSNEVHFVDDAWLTVAPSATTPPAAAGGFAVRINVGSSSDLVAPDGTRFVADRGYVGGSATGVMASAVEGTQNDALYVKHRWGMSGYSIPVPAPGAYTVRLHFAEPVFSARGMRVFDVSAESALRLNDLDVFATAGTNTALVKQFDVAVSDSTLDLGFTAVVEDPMVSGIEVIAATGSTTTTTTGAGPAAVPATTTTTVPPTTTTTAPPSAPSAGGYPNAANTGPSGALTPSGSITTSSSGQVIQNLDINGEIRVQHNNVTIRNVRIRSDGGNAINILGNTGLLIEDCELDGQGRNAEAAVAEHNYTMRRCEVRGYGEGPRINGNVTIEDSYIHSFANFIGVGAHQDCIQATSGMNIIIRHNTCLMNVDGGNGAVFLGSFAGGNVLIENNLIAGGGYALGIDGQLYSNVTVRNNRWSTIYYPRGGYHGPILTNGGVFTMSNNVWHDGPNAGQPIS